MTSSNDLRRYAAACVAFAEKASNGEDRVRLLEMARAFYELANKQEERAIQLADEPLTDGRGEPANGRRDGGAK